MINQPFNFQSNRQFSKSIVNNGGSGNGSNDTTNNSNKNNIPRNLNGDKFGKHNGNGKDGTGLPCPKCGNPKCVSVDLAGIFAFG